jgi:hypothetical protein
VGGGGGRGNTVQGWQKRRARKEGKGWKEAVIGKGIRDWGATRRGETENRWGSASFPIFVKSHPTVKSHPPNLRTTQIEGRAGQQSPGYPRPHSRGPAEPFHAALRSPPASLHRIKIPPIFPAKSQVAELRRQGANPLALGPRAQQSPGRPRPYRRGPAKPSLVAIGSPVASPCPIKNSSLKTFLFPSTPEP